MHQQCVKAERARKYATEMHVIMLLPVEAVGSVARHKVPAAREHKYLSGNMCVFLCVCVCAWLKASA